MKKGHIHIIILLMSLALIGLIGLQVYWIGKAIELSEANFNSSVHDALNQVAERLEQDEFNIFFIQAAEDLDILEETERRIEVHTESDNPHIQHSITVKLKGGSVGERVTEVRATTSQGDSLDLDRIETIDVRKGPTARHLYDSLSGKKVRAEMIMVATDSLELEEGGRNWEWNDKYLDAFQKTLVEIHAQGDDIGSRLDSARIDTLIAAALRDQGLDQRYQFWVEAEENSADESERYVFKTGNISVADVPASPHRVRLFPTQDLDSRNFLHAYFPGQRLYTMRSVWWMTAASVLFTSIILICFGLTIRTIFRQKKLSEMRNDFINNMTHELKTPLATISLAADSIRDLQDPQSESHVSRYTDIIKAENQRMHRQVERMLQAARFERGEFSLRRELQDVNPLIMEAVLPFRMRAEERGGKLEAALVEGISLELDKVHFSNVLHNLLDNAIKYSPLSPEVSLKSYVTESTWGLMVSDRGTGIRKAEQAHIFDRFYRVPAGDLHEIKGFGLGLSYVRDIVQAHGGTISVSSQPGQGSTFTIEFDR